MSQTIATYFEIFSLLLSLEGIALEEQSSLATAAARATGTIKKQVAPEDLLEEAFELNMQLEEMRQAFNFINPHSTKSCGCGSSFST
jgi:hypothetical protein